MRAFGLISRLRDESGAVLVEFAIVSVLFFLLVFMALDFGRLMFTVVEAEKAAQIASRIATTRNPVCSGVPASNARPTGATGLAKSGTSCDAALDICTPVSFSCGSILRSGSGMTHSALNVSDPTVVEIWNRIAPLMPPSTTSAVLNFRYDFDPALGFLGGPYTPIVTVELDLPDFQFVSPIGALAGLASEAGGSTLPNTISYPTFSVSLPAEDLMTGPTN